MIRIEKNKGRLMKVNQPVSKIEDRLVIKFGIKCSKTRGRSATHDLNAGLAVEKLHKRRSVWHYEIDSNDGVDQIDPKSQTNSNVCSIDGSVAK